MGLSNLILIYSQTCSFLSLIVSTDLQKMLAKLGIISSIFGVERTHIQTTTTTHLSYHSEVIPTRWAPTIVRSYGAPLGVKSMGVYLEVFHPTLITVFWGPACKSSGQKSSPTDLRLSPVSHLFPTFCLAWKDLRFWQNPGIFLVRLNALCIYIYIYMYIYCMYIYINKLCKNLYVIMHNVKLQKWKQTCYMHV